MTDNRENQTVPYMITCDLDGKNQKNIMLEGTEPVTTEVTTEETTESKVVAEDTPSDFVEEEYHYTVSVYHRSIITSIRGIRISLTVRKGFSMD